MAEATNQTTGITKFLDQAANTFKIDSRRNESSKQDRELIVPAWIPESYIRSRKKNLYLNMLNVEAVGEAGEHLDFYTESGGGESFMDKMKSMLGSALASAATLVTNQVGAVANAAQSVASSLGLTDESETDNFKNEDISSLPFMTVYGFNVSPPITQTLEIIKQSFEVLKNIVNSDDGFGDFFKKLGNALKATLKELKLLDDSDNFNVSSCFNMQHGMAERLIMSSAAGVYLMSAKIPYINNEKPFLSVTSSRHQWHGGLTNNDGFLGKAVEVTGLNMAISPQINWISNDLESISPVKTRFTLYNDTFEHLKVNFLFIMGFIQTAMPVTGGILIKSPFLYDIVLPDGAKYYSCTCDIEIKSKGKLRELGQKAAEVLGKAIGKKNIIDCGESTLSSRFKDLTSKHMLFFPDAYEVDITFTSLLPDTWNLISGWLIDSNNASTPEMGEKKDTILVKAIKAFGDKLKEQQSANTETKTGES